MTIAHFFQLQPITAGAFAVCVALALLNAVTKRETMCVVRGSDGVSMVQWWWWPLYASMAVAIDTVRMIVWSVCDVSRPNQSFSSNAFVLVPEARCTGGVFSQFVALTVVCLSNLLLLSVALFAVQAAACGDIGPPMLWGPIALVFAWSARLASVRVVRRRRPTLLLQTLMRQRRTIRPIWIQSEKSETTFHVFKMFTSVSKCKK